MAKTEKAIMQHLSIKKWDEINTLEQFKAFVAVMYKMSNKELQKILQKIPDLKNISNEYFDDVIYTIANHEPALMYEFEDVKLYIDDNFLKDGRANYLEMAGIWIDYSVWLTEESIVNVESEGKRSQVTVCEALEIAREHDQAGSDEDGIKFIYGYERRHEDIINDFHFAQSGSEGEMDDLINELYDDEQRKMINSRLN